MPVFHKQSWKYPSKFKITHFFNLYHILYTCNDWKTWKKLKFMTLGFWTFLGNSGAMCEGPSYIHTKDASKASIQGPFF